MSYQKNSFCEDNILFTRDLANLTHLRRSATTNQKITLQNIQDKYGSLNVQVEGVKLFERINRNKPQQITSSVLWKCVLSEFKWGVFLSYLFKQIESLLRIALSYFICRIFDSLQQDQKWKCYLFVGVTGIVWLLQAVFDQLSWSNVQMTSLKIKGSLTYAIYLKMLSISAFSVSGNQSGEIINSIIQFHDILENQSIYIFVCLSAPLSIIGLTALLVNQIGWISVAGVFLSILFEFIHFHYANFNSQYFSDISKFKDKRMQVLTEVISAFRYIKMQVWERFFLNKIAAIREQEMKGFIKYGAGRSLQISLSEGVSTASMLLIIGVAAKMNDSLTAKIIIGSVLNILLIKLLIIYSSYGISCYYQINSLAERVASVFGKQSKPPRIANKDQEKEIDFHQINIKIRKRQKNVIILNKVWCSYRKNIEQQYNLKDMTLSVEQGEFIGVFGRVGQGKSTFLNCIAQQMPYIRGKITLLSEVAFQQAQPALFSGTVAENILFGKQMKTDLYKKAIKYSCLDSDLAIMPLGDNSKVQEGAVNFSGGQRTRICLARAIYADTPIILLDDPLSSLDLKVIQKIMTNLKKLNKNDKKTIILVSHQIHCLIKCDRCIEINNKQIKTLTHQQFLSVKQTYSFEQDQQLQDSFNQQDEKGQENTLAQGSNKKISQKNIQFEQSIEYEDQIPTSGLIVSFLGYVFQNKWNYLVFPLTLLSYTISQSLYAFLVFYLNEFDSIQAGTHNIFRSQGTFWMTLGIMSGCIFLFQIIRTFLLNLTIQLANKTLHRKALAHIFKSHVLQLDRLGSKGILDKFSTDLGPLDVGILSILSSHFIVSFITIIQTIIIAVVNPIILAFIAAIVILLYLWYRYCIKTVIIVRAIDLKEKGCVIALFSQTLNGLIQIENMNAQEYMLQKLKVILNNSVLLGLNFRKITRVYTAYINYYTTLVLIGSFFGMIAMSDSSNYGSFTFAAVFLVQINQCFSWMISNSTKINSTMINVKRILSLTKIKTDLQFKSQKEPQNIYRMTNDCGSQQKLREDFHSIKLEQVSLRYGEGQDLALKKLSISMNPGQKIALIGRTGSGKSSVIQVLYRLVDVQPDSSYTIQGENALAMNIADLRHKFVCIPQVPFLFSDTLRCNMDPFQRFKDQQISNALQKVCISQYVNQLPQGINTSLSQSQVSLSAGQKQLICLARAILEKKNFLILDQATSNIDHKTDQIIQTVLRRQFKGKTIISVAHRLQTILDYDKIIVLSKGEIKQMGTALQLWQAKGEFYGMIQQSGHQRYKLIQKIKKLQEETR